MSETTIFLQDTAGALREIASRLDAFEEPEKEFEFDVYALDWAQRAEAIQALIGYDQDEVAEQLRDAGYTPVDLSDVIYQAGQLADAIDSLKYVTIEDAESEISDAASLAYSLQSELEGLQ